MLWPTSQAGWTDVIYLYIYLAVELPSNVDSVSVSE